MGACYQPPSRYGGPYDPTPCSKLVCLDTDTLQEATLFPALNTKMDFSHEKEQHAAVHAFLDDFLATVQAAQADTSKFDAAKLKSMLESSNDAIVSRFIQQMREGGI